jgi:hypothetical protein
LSVALGDDSNTNDRQYCNETAERYLNVVLRYALDSLQLHFDSVYVNLSVGIGYASSVFHKGYSRSDIKQIMNHRNCVDDFLNLCKAICFGHRRIKDTLLIDCKMNDAKMSDLSILSKISLSLVGIISRYFEHSTRKIRQYNSTWFVDNETVHVDININDEKFKTLSDYF